MVRVQLLVNYLLLASALLLRLLRLSRRHRSCISSSTARNWEAVKANNMVASQLQQRRRGRVSERIQVLLVLLVSDDLATVRPDLLLLVALPGVAHEAFPLAVPEGS